MKKSLFIALALVLSVSFTACEGPEGPMGPSGPPGYNGSDGKDGKDGRDGDGANWHTTSFTVAGEEWRLSGRPGDLDSYFYAYKDLPKLTDYVFRYGTVIAYIETGQGVKNGLPFVLHRGEEVDGKEFIWTETYDFDFEVGALCFYATYSDFNTYLTPGPETFHVVLMW